MNKMKKFAWVWPAALVVFWAVALLMLSGCAGGHPVFVMSYDLLEERLADASKYIDMTHSAMLDAYAENLAKVDPAILMGLQMASTDGKVTIAQVQERLAKASTIREKILQNQELARDAYDDQQENFRIMRMVIADGRNLAIYMSNVREQWKSYMMSLRPATSK